MQMLSIIFNINERNLRSILFKDPTIMSNSIE